MGNAPPWVWLTQAAGLGLWGLACFLVPGLTLALLSGSPTAQLPAIATDQLRMSAPYLLGLSGFTVFAAMTRHTVLRRAFALVFATAFGLWSAAFCTFVFADRYATPARVLVGLVAMLALVNLVIALGPPPGRRRPEDAGTSDTKPPHAFVFWLLQGLVLLSGALTFLFAGDWILSRISGAPAAGLPPLAVDQTRLLGALATGIAAFSFVAMGTRRSFAWRGFAFFFSVFLALWTLSIFWILIFGQYAPPVLTVLVPGLLFLPANVALGCVQGEWEAEDLADDPHGWRVLDLVAGPLMALSVLRTRRRSSHLVGVGARGRFRPLPRFSPEPLQHDFFRHACDVRVRFANLTELDDASLDVRGCSVQFVGNPHGPFDLLMNTGSFCPAYNLFTFAGFVASKLVPRAGSAAIVKKNLVAREGGVAGLRRAPESYARLCYYGQIVRYWLPDDRDDEPGVRHLVRYRCVPAEPGEESGLPDDDDASHIWIRGRRAEERRPTDYLRRELGRRLENGGVVLRLQAQFHAPQAGDGDEWFNASVDWDEDDHPWYDLGTLELEVLLPDDETERLLFDPGRHPVTLGIPRATGPWDYRSLGDSEARVVRALQRLRLWLYERHGLPPFGRVAGR